MAENDSSSGEITTAFVNVSDVFTQYTEMPSRGFNVLYKAQRWGKWFVLKGLKPEFRQSAVHLQLLTKEFELGIQMTHPNIVLFYSKEVDPLVGDCIVMEYVDGETLSAFLKNKSNHSHLREKIAKQLLQAMAYYQNLQIVHRDLKPDNVLISRNGCNVKIIDFGLSDSDSSAILKQPAGSPKYVAPEQLDGTVKIDARADLYSFAQILRSLHLFGLKWRRVGRLCGKENRDKRPTDAAAVLNILSKQYISSLITISILLLLLLAGGAFLALNRGNDSSPQQPAATPQEQTLCEQIASPKEDSLQPVNAVSHKTESHQIVLAEITPEMDAFIQAEVAAHWQSVANVVASHQERISSLAAGVPGVFADDKKIYNDILLAYSDVCNGVITHQEATRQALCEKYPSAKQIPNYDLDQSYCKCSYVYNNKYSKLCNDIYINIAKVDTN